MPVAPPSPCTQPGCPELVDEPGPCAEHKKQRRRQSDRDRGTAAERGYSGKRWDAARTATLNRDPICKCDSDTCADHGTHCHRPSTVADHYPKTRKQLIAEGVTDPDQIKYLRGMCKACHDRHTAATTPGGWHAR